MDPAAREGRLTPTNPKPVRVRAVRAVARLSDPSPDVVHAVAEALRVDPAEEMRAAAAATLGTIGAASETPALERALSDSSARVRRAAAASLGRVADGRSAQSLVISMTDVDRAVRAEAAAGLASIAQRGETVVRDCIEALVKGLSDDYFVVRVNSAQALGRVGDRSAVVALVVALNDRNWLVVEAAAEALARVGDLKALKPLQLRRRRSVLCRRGLSKAISTLDSSGT